MGDGMIYITVNPNEFLALLCWLGFVCCIGTLVTDKTDGADNFLHYVLGIAEVLLWLGTILVMVLFT